MTYPIHLWLPEEINDLKERDFYVDGRETNFFYGLVKVNDNQIILCNIIPGIGYNPVNIEDVTEIDSEAIICLFNLLTFNPNWYTERSSEDEYTIKQTLKDIKNLKIYNTYQKMVGEIKE